MQIQGEGLAGPITATLSAGEIIQNKYDQRRQLVELSLSAPIWKTLEAMREDVFTVTNGRIVEATRIDRQKMPVNGRQRWVSDRWSLTVRSDDGEMPTTIAMTSGRDCSEPGAICSIEGGRLDNAPTLTFGPLGTVVAPTTLSIADTSAPENSDWMTFTITLSEQISTGIKIRFRTTGGGTATAGDDYASTDEEIVIPPKTQSWGIGVRLADDNIDDADETIGVEISEAWTINRDGEEGAVIETTRLQATGTIEAPATTTSSVGSIWIAGTSAREREHWLRFKVKRSNSSLDRDVCYDFETLTTGTATPETDFYPVTKNPRWMPSGQKKEVEKIRIVNDAVNDPGETVKVRISNARVCDDASLTLNITTNQATGTINNADPVPQAWMSRFGRTVADQVLDAVQTRMNAPRSTRVEASLVGVDIGTAFDATGMERHPHGGEGATHPSRPMPVSQHDLMHGTAFALNGETEEDGRTRSLSGRDVLVGSSFSLAAETEGGGFAGLWGRMAQTRFAGREDALSLDGDVTTGLVGADYASGRWTTGLVVSHSIGEGGYQASSRSERNRGDEGSGDIEATVTALTPWAGYAVTERLSVWGAAGYGAGELKLTAGDDPALKTDLGMTLAAAGARGALIDGDGPKLDAVGDARWVRTTTARVSSSAGNLASASADVTRLRLGLEGSWPLVLDEGAFGKGGTVTPRLALGVRHDGGDAETGFGADIGGGVALAAPAHGLTVSLEGRGVLTHEAAGLRDRGVAGTLAWNPPPADRGPQLTLTQSIGAGASGGTDALLSRDTLEGLAANDDGDGRRRLEARFGYGIGMFEGRFTMTPEIGLGLSQAGRDYSLGWRLTRAGSGAGSLELSLQARRRESANDDTLPEHGIGLAVTARW